MRRLPVVVLALMVATSATTIIARQQQPAPPSAQPPPAPNQAALAEARGQAKAGHAAEALAALERVTPPAPVVLNQLRTSDDFKALRGDARFEAIVAELHAVLGAAVQGVRLLGGRVGGAHSRGSAAWPQPHFQAARRLRGRRGLGGRGRRQRQQLQRLRPADEGVAPVLGRRVRNELALERQAGNPLEHCAAASATAPWSCPRTPTPFHRIGQTRVTWRPLPDGRVRQTFESSTDGGKTWSVSFDGFYKTSPPGRADSRRLAAGPPPAR